MGRADSHISGEELSRHVLKIIYQQKENGMTTADVIDNYKFNFGLAARGKDKSDKKRDILNHLEKHRKDGEIQFLNGVWIHIDYLGQDYV
ncbi:MAG: hypothetical protein V1818_01895 [Candidatus Aenigmatarchaeota archaeon]